MKDKKIEILESEVLKAEADNNQEKVKALMSNIYSFITVEEIKLAHKEYKLAKLGIFTND